MAKGGKAAIIAIATINHLDCERIVNMNPDKQWVKNNGVSRQLMTACEAKSLNMNNQYVTATDNKTDNTTKSKGRVRK